VKKEQKTWVAVLGGGGLIAAGLAYLIYAQLGSIAESRAEVEQLRQEASASRKLIEGTGALEREVIVQREMSEVISNILPDNEDMNNWVRIIQDFSDESGVSITGLKKQNSAAVRGRGKSQTAFDEVTYAFTIDSDAFELLDFMNLVETHKRFMAVPKFKIAAASRQSVEANGLAGHKVNLDIQTFVYEPQSDGEVVRIEGYDRKRTLMVGEINRRRQDLALAEFTYRGDRGRRDPFVDPRVPVEGGSALSVPEQMEIVQGLVDQMVAVRETWQAVQDSENVIEEMMARRNLEQSFALLEESVRRVESEASISYLPSQRRLQLEVVDALVVLRASLSESTGTIGPSVEKLREVLEAMNRHFDRQEYDLALEAFRVVGDQLDYVEADPLRKPFVEHLRKKALVARIVREFEEIEIEVGGVAITEGGPSVALINGESVAIGDMLGRSLFVNGIRPDEIEFIYRGVVLARRF
jgi:hypothetical protein